MTTANSPKNDAITKSNASLLDGHASNLRRSTCVLEQVKSIWKDVAVAVAATMNTVDDVGDVREAVGALWFTQPDGEPSFFKVDAGGTRRAEDVIIAPEQCREAGGVAQFEVNLSCGPVDRIAGVQHSGI